MNFMGYFYGSNISKACFWISFIRFHGQLLSSSFTGLRQKFGLIFKNFTVITYKIGLFVFSVQDFLQLLFLALSRSILAKAKIFFDSSPRTLRTAIKIDWPNQIHPFQEVKLKTQLIFICVCILSRSVQFDSLRPHGL